MPLGRQTVWVCRTLLQMGPDPSREGAILLGEAVASLPALGSWAPPAERGPSLESIYRFPLQLIFAKVIR